MKNILYPVERRRLSDDIIEQLKDLGYDVLVSIGAPEENLIGSNCGQYIRKHLDQKKNIDKGYQYQTIRVNWYLYI